MAIIYVSQTTTNGYAMGDDARNKATAASKLTPVLTPDRAIEISENGDEIIINDGVYPATTLTYFNLNKNLTINPENYRATRLTATSAARLFNVVSTDVTLGALVLDGLGNPVGLFNMNSLGDNYTYVFNGTEFVDADWYAIYQSKLNKVINLTLNGVKMGGVNERGGMWIRSLAAGSSVTIDGLEFDLTAIKTGQFPGIAVVAIAPNVSFSAKNVTGTIALDSIAPIGIYRGIVANNIKDALMEDCNIDIVGVGAGSASAYHYQISPLTTDTQDSSGGVIRRCGGTNNTTGGITALIGTDGSNALTDNQANNGLITDCDFVGGANASGLHGPMIGHQTNCRIEKATTDNCDTGGNGILKGATDCIVSGTLAINCSSTFNYQKGCTNCLHTNNTSITSASGAATHEVAAYDDTASPIKQGSGSTFSNNVLTGTNLPSLIANQGTGNPADTTSGTTFSKTHYDSSIGTPIRWLDGTTTYTTLAAFNASSLVPAGEECVSADLGLVSNTLPQGSAFLAVGVKKWGARPNPSTQGDPLPDSSIDIGYVQSTNSPTHSSNL